MQQALAHSRFRGQVAKNKVFTDEEIAAIKTETVNIPDDELMVIKEVPAKVDGTVVGVAQIYDDGSVGVVLDEDAPEWALDKIKSEASMVGYQLATEGE